MPFLRNEDRAAQPKGGEEQKCKQMAFQIQQKLELLVRIPNFNLPAPPNSSCQIPRPEVAILEPEDYDLWLNPGDRSAAQHDVPSQITLPAAGEFQRN
jgi:hypothetical protein